MNILGASIRNFRKNKGLTQIELSKLTGLKQNTISNHENGKRLLDENDILCYAKALNISPQELFDNANASSIDNNLTRLTNNYQKLNDFDKQKLVDYSDELVDERYLKLVRENAAANDGKLHNQRTEKSEKAKAKFLKETGLIDENNL